MTQHISVTVHSLSNSDALGYLGQQAVADATGSNVDYRIIGGHMVRLLLHVYPTPNTVLRSTLDADAAVGDVEVIGPLTEHLMAGDFTKEHGNLFYKEVQSQQRIEINLLLSREGPAPGIRAQSVPGVGQVDTLPELRFALISPALVLDVEADLGNQGTITYQTRIPDVEAAVVLKAHSWNSRRSEKDVADLHSLLEIREAHPQVDWRLNATDPIGFRKDSGRILHELGSEIARKRVPFQVPSYVDRLRMAGLIQKHIG